jgi:hypothetical protein
MYINIKRELQLIYRAKLEYNKEFIRKLYPNLSEEEIHQKAVNITNRKIR